MPKKKLYVVWEGKKTGVFRSWDETKASVDGFKGAKYKSYPSEVEANTAFSLGYSAAINGNSSSSNSKTKNSNKKELLPETNINIFCDGSCIPNPGEAGSGISIYKNDVLIKAYYGGYQEFATNNVAELLAFNFALKIVDKSSKSEMVSIHIDSQYTINCITKWASGWKRNSWKRSNNEEIQNLELIKSTYELYLSLEKQVLIKKVKAHNDIEGNEIADRLANYGRMTKQQKFSQYKNLNIENILNIP
jgi:ribonuclease HI